jgi:hypothetical protein
LKFLFVEFEKLNKKKATKSATIILVNLPIC